MPRLEYNERRQNLTRDSDWHFFGIWLHSALQWSSIYINDNWWTFEQQQQHTSHTTWESTLSILATAATHDNPIRIGFVYKEENISMWNRGNIIFSNPPTTVPKVGQWKYKVKIQAARAFFNSWIIPKTILWILNNLRRLSHASLNQFLSVLVRSCRSLFYVFSVQHHNHSGKTVVSVGIRHNFPCDRISWWKFSNSKVYRTYLSESIFAAKEYKWQTYGQKVRKIVRKVKKITFPAPRPQHFLQRVWKRFQNGGEEGVPDSLLHHHCLQVFRFILRHVLRHVCRYILLFWTGAKKQN